MEPPTPLRVERLELFIAKTPTVGLPGFSQVGAPKARFASPDGRQQVVHLNQLRVEGDELKIKLEKDDASFVPLEVVENHGRVVDCVSRWQIKKNVDDLKDFKLPLEEAPAPLVPAGFQATKPAAAAFQTHKKYAPRSHSVMEIAAGASSLAANPAKLAAASSLFFKPAPRPAAAITPAKKPVWVQHGDTPIDEDSIVESPSKRARSNFADSHSMSSPATKRPQASLFDKKRDDDEGLLAPTGLSLSLKPPKSKLNDVIDLVSDSGDGENDPKISISRRGIRNEGNTCFANSCVQALASLKCFNNDLKAKFWDRASAESCPAFAALRKTLSACQSGAVVRIFDLLQGVRTVFTHTGGQEDVHEFFVKLFAGVDNELSQLWRKNSELQLLAKDMWPSAFTDASHSPFECLNALRTFSSLVKLEIECVECHFKRSHNETFVVHSLDFDSEDSGVVSLEDMLKGHFKQDRRALTCERCEALEAFVTPKLAELPQVFCVHLKRFVRRFDNIIRKRNDWVDVPLELDVSSIIDPGTPCPRLLSWPIMGANAEVEELDRGLLQARGSSTRYRLQSSVHHIGVSCNAGHYVATARVVENSGFAEFDDDRVTRLPDGWHSEERFANSSMLLFYELVI